VTWVVLLRGANVGGNSFRPTELVRDLPRLHLASFGAAGTFTAATDASEGQVTTALRSRLPFEAPIFCVPAEELLRLLRANPLGDGSFEPGVRRYVTVMDRPLPASVRLPHVVPSPSEWGVRVQGAEGRFAVGLYRRVGERLVYPNEVIERAFGVTATTRWWETLVQVGATLAGPSARVPDRRAAAKRPVSDSRRAAPRRRRSQP